MFDASLEMVPLEIFVMPYGSRKSDGPVRRLKKFDDIGIRLYAIPQPDGQTDGRTDKCHMNIAASV